MNPLELFPEAAKWNIEKLVKDINDLRDRFENKVKLSEIYQYYLCGKLAGYENKDIAQKLNKKGIAQKLNKKEYVTEGGIKTACTEEINRNIKQLLQRPDELEKTMNWARACVLLEEAGYRTESLPESKDFPATKSSLESEEKTDDISLKNDEDKRHSDFVIKGTTDELVANIRRSNYKNIQQQYGKIQLLYVSHPVNIDYLYVDVNLLSEPNNYSYLRIEDLLQNHDLRDDFNRLGLPKQLQRISAVTALTEYPRLMVLGKPGSGKTTFLRHIIFECNNSNILSDYVSVLIELKDFARRVKNTGRFSLKCYLDYYLKGCSSEEIRTLLEEGRFLLLLDGLDEVAEEYGDKVVDEINDFMYEFGQNKLIVSCRIQSLKYRFDGFTYVELADFGQEQVINFSQKYFNCINTSTKQKQEKVKTKTDEFIKQLELPENKSIRDLAVTPILLSLICKTFSYEDTFYSKRHELYEHCLEILLSEWDETRNIKRDKVYYNLTLEDKKKLLKYIAYRKFKQQQKVLFEYTEIIGYITEHLNISEAESQAVLEAIIVQHGLLIERTKGIYSFSHLTFQEYFAAKEIESSSLIEELVNHMSDKSWREVFVLVSGMIKSTKDAENLLKQIQQAINKLKNNDKEIQEFFYWVQQKSQAINSSYKPAAVRAFYYVKAFDNILETEGNLERISHVAKELATMLDFNIDSILVSMVNPEIELEHNLVIDGFLAITFAFASDTFEAARKGENDMVTSLNNSLSDVLEHSISLTINSDESVDKKLGKDLKDLNELRKFETEELHQEWWATRGESWTINLKKIIYKYRNIRKDWKFSEEQAQYLLDYCSANLLMVECLNQVCNISDEVRSEIEQKLLL